ncbi:condensin subunit Smc [Clostridium cavendishii DSM 21758]|uniref:Chromosome partition protein Smc n=1 Tax=Clostridium cavendishii DSM 21758 TaxID=1121302 RepID=A0A1M6K6M9_9CLOT|nr:chromosome segregation protein SMC [Clostridium cavendishii]SHJ54574.1 condensin subunit Smc [Clostridium cavendishii DSM 21758]
MFLKSLEIRGFKSFADKTELKFKKGVTAVVGPNGSGKSNISDSVRWVLGEQSVKTLRGGKMEDVIFAGTHFRKPVGLAQVSLTLDNTDKELATDYSEVTITRRIFRSGESEYLLNNTQCRLKDITALFMDTGIGKEGYSLIGQGKIEAILSGKPEERRNLLEEAAGIVKFKSRKIEAEKKLENTEQNLVRINDIISTFEERIEPLRIENEKANKFLGYSERLKEKEISLIVYFLRNIDKNINEQKEAIEVLKSENEKSKISYEIKSKKLGTLNENLDILENNHNNEINIYYENKEKINKISSDIDILKERINSIKNLINLDKESKTKLEALNYDLKSSKENIILEIENKSLEEKNILTEINDLKEKENFFLETTKDKEVSLNEKRDEEFEVLKTISDINNKNTVLVNQEKSIISLIENSRNNVTNYENALKINLSTKNMLNVNLDNIKLKVEDLQKTILNNKTRLTKSIAINNENEKKYKNINFEINKLEANSNMLSNLEKQYEGYNRAVKSIMESIKNSKLNVSKEHCHVLGEIINVKRGYEVAIEIALGASVSNIIVENENLAKDLISYLKANRLGRATFLPLTTIKGKKIEVPKHITLEQGYLGVASELISFDKKYENCINYVLGRTLICEDIDSAIRVAKKTNYSYKIVTQEGEVITPGGALTGGSIHSKNSGVITRRAEIDKLALELKNLKNVKQELEVKLKDLKTEIKNLDEENLNLKDEVHYKNIELTKLESEIANINKEKSSLANNIEISKKDIELSSERLGKLKNDLAENNEKLEAATKKQKEIRETIISLENYMKEGSDFLKTNQEKLTSLKVNKAKLDEYVLSKKNELLRAEKDIEDNEVRLKEIAVNIVNNEKLIEENHCKIDKYNEEIEATKLALKETEELFKEYEVNKIKLKEDIKSISSELEFLRLEIGKKEEEVHKQDIVYTKLISEKDSHFTRLNDEFEISYAEALDYAKEIVDLSAHKDEIVKLKGSIFRLGTVNVSAIEEYKDVLEKYNFMSSQREDLEKSKEEILSVISDMTKKMKEVFKENFNVLNSYFDETFKELFKGGSAELILSEGDELTANIDINVEPPGKKVQNINLMSGGEKVLSAIALLFAILKMKPTPFCILDEIEAALDDANVFRYAEFLKEFSKDVQFIVITHRKGTMEASDVMYGVTMQEKGVSKVVSVDLSK